MSRQRYEGASLAPLQVKMNISQTVIDLEALLYALTQQTESLPESLQRSLIKVSQDLREDRPEAAGKLRKLIAEFPPLEKAYQKALAEWDKGYASQSRAKSLSAVFPSTVGLDSLFVYTVTPTSDWIATAKKLTRQHSSDNNSTFWDKSDRLVVMIAGGAALGTAIAQLPGALVGAILAAGYGWYISFGKTKSIENS